MQAIAPGPAILHIPTSPGCNNRCEFCLDEARGMGRFTLQQHIEQLRAGRSISDGVVFTNGEPTLTRHLPDAVAAARDLGFSLIGLISNGRRLSDRSFAEALLDAGLNEVTISAHGPTADVHDAITRRKGSFEQTRRGLANLQELRNGRRFTFHVNCTLVQKNLPHLQAMVDYARGFDIDRLNFNVVEARGTARKLFADVQPRYVDVVAAMLSSGLDFGRPELCMSRIPPCAGGMDWSQEDFHLTVDGDVTHFRPEVGKVRGPPCGQCAVAGTCPGIWEGYAEGYGWDEFQPIQRPHDGTLRVRLGADCLNHCARCAEGPHSKAPAPGSPYKQLTDGYIAGHRRVLLTGGDPLLDARLPGLLQAARRMGYRHLAIETNGRLLSQTRFADAVAALDLDEIRVRLHGPDAATADAHTGVRGAHRQALRGIQNLRDRRLRFAMVRTDP